MERHPHSPENKQTTNPDLAAFLGSLPMSDRAAHNQVFRENVAIRNLVSLNIPTEEVKTSGPTPEKPTDPKLEADLVKVTANHKKHFTRKLDDDGYALKSKEPPVAKKYDNPLPRSRSQQRFDHKLSALANQARESRVAINGHAQGKEHLILNQGEDNIPLSSKEVKGRLREEDNTIFSRISIMSASRGARKAHKRLNKIERKLRKIAEGDDLKGKYLKTRAGEEYSKTRSKASSEYLWMYPDDINSGSVLSLLSYADAVDGKDLVAMQEHNESNPSYHKYAQELIALADKHGAKMVYETAIKQRGACLRELREQGLKPSEYSKSITWVLWDIAKQSYLNKHPDESGPEYTLGDPLSGDAIGEKILGDITARQIGWEYQGEFLQNNQSLEHLSLNRNKREALTKIMLEGRKNRDGLLSSSELSKLGHIASK